MKKIITVLAFLICNYPLWCSQVVVGVNSDKVIIWEYWKFDLGVENHEMLIFNPSKEKIEVVFRKWYPREENMPVREYLASDVLLSINHLKPNDYVLFDDPTPRMRKHYRGLIEVLINGESAGLYRLTRTATPPANKIEEGIVINQIANIGEYHPYEIIYESQRFKRNNNPRVKVVFPQEHFLGSGFNRGEKFNPNGIELEDIVTSSLEVVTKEEYDVYFVPTGKEGYFELSFVVEGKASRVLQRNFFLQTTEKRAQGIRFILPYRVRFDQRRRYQ